MFQIYLKRYKVGVDPDNPTKMRYTTTYWMSDGLTQRIEHVSILVTIGNPAPDVATLDAQDAAVLAAANP